MSYEEKQLGSLKEVVRDHQPGDQFIFPSMIPDSPKIHQFTAQRKAMVAHSAEGRQWFEAVCLEFERRVRR